ncbi:hypothetical protein PPERSA_09946 [Pseudocohnilembus persalinus]|uniref:Uncharacterized protein n=1 Tax=Pseudocohnilembus persalinus TaxID=266149 RepID=A0A0V0QJB2_PSEPJ|nr:hypothetical protein PPERSA_09946 [Pseudocohnilembus persalinus]|eukprot:KRX02329.1 hypothetical protein PPERSA_09946 [Pseudocohnilembus persalinus]
MNVIGSLTMSFIHAIDTYAWIYNQPSIPGNQNLQDIQNLIEFSLNIYFILDLLLNIYISENKLFQAFQAINIVEYISILPTFLLRLNLYSATKVIVSTRALRFLLISKLTPLFAKRSWDVGKQYFQLIFTVLSILWLGSNFLLVVEKQDYAFHNYFYFCIVTLSTVGFGDIYPKSELGRLCVVIILISLLSILPRQAEALKRSLNQNSEYARKSYKRSQNQAKHIVILGNTNTQAYHTFLEEFYHKDHGFIETPCVIFKNRPPDEEMKSLLQ